MPHVRRNIVCQNCPASTPLPIPIPQRISQRPELWTMFGEQIIFVCPQCAHGFQYNLRDFPSYIYEGPDPFDGPNGLSLACIELECADSNCEARARLHTVLSATTTDELRKWILTWQLEAIACPLGHPVHPPRQW